MSIFYDLQWKFSAGHCSLKLILQTTEHSYHEAKLSDTKQIIIFRNLNFIVLFALGITVAEPPRVVTGMNSSFLILCFLDDPVCHLRASGRAMFLSLFHNTEPFECCFKTRYGKNGLFMLEIFLMQ